MSHLSFGRTELWDWIISGFGWIFDVIFRLHEFLLLAITWLLVNAIEPIFTIAYFGGLIVGTAWIMRWLKRRLFG